MVFCRAGIEEPPSQLPRNSHRPRVNGNARITIPAGARIATSDGSVTFVVTQAAILAPDQKSVEAPALHCDTIEAESVGAGTGAPGQSVQVRRPPIIAPSGDGLDLIVGVEADSAELADGAVSRTLADKSYLDLARGGQLRRRRADRLRLPGGRAPRAASSSRRPWPARAPRRCRPCRPWGGTSGSGTASAAAGPAMWPPGS